VNFEDMNPLVMAVTGVDSYSDGMPTCTWHNADFTGDGVVDFHDINAFVAALAAGD
jgi:hypothetical protein